jgi:SAM-dependent methyltransferase
MANVDIREFFKKYPRFYYLVANVLGPVWWSGVSSKAYLKTVAGQGRILNLGSGPKILGDARVINVDLFDYPGVDIVASIDQVPLPDASIDGIVIDNVMEHVREPKAVVKEMSRLLKSGGTVYIATPFMYPFHSSPADYSRWTLPGLESLIGDDFENIKSGVRCGPISALTSFLAHFFATLLSFGNHSLRHALFNVCMLPFVPLKVLDAIFAHVPGAEEMAAVLYVVARKK